MSERSKYYRDPETGEDFYTPEALRDRALGVAKRLFQWEGHDIPLAYSGKAPVTDPMVERVETLDPARVDEERYLREPPRSRVSLGMWRLCNEVSVEHQLESNELMAWRNRTEALRKGPVAVDKDTAKEIACSVIGEPPWNAIGPSVKLMGDGADEKVFQVSWVHFVPGNVIVDGDFLLVRVNAATAKPCSYFRRWRRVPGDPPADGTDADAKSPAGAAAGPAGGSASTA